MKKLFLFTIIYFTAFSFSNAQGTVRGKITDENGEPAIGAGVMRKSSKTLGAVADMEGNYSFIVSDSTKDTLVISWVGYDKIEEPIHLVNGKVIIKNFSFSLSKSNNVIKEVEVTAKAVKAKDYYMEKMKMNSSVTLDYISLETMKKTGDANVTAAIARVPGVSTSGAFITVRGIGDRYIKTTINGCRIPTLDPFTNNIKLDMFPSSLIDNVIITKTASPDLPGDWAGAYLSVQTKDYPEKFSVIVESTVGYNGQSTFKDVITSQRSSTDWLGYDNSLRAHSQTGFASANTDPTTYQQFVALGLGDYYKSLGVTNSTPWNDTYYKLGLVQLGLLPPALFNDPNAVANAKSKYTSGPYINQTFDIINAPAVKSGQSFADNWNTFFRKAPLDFSQSFSIGNQTKLFGRELGVIAGFRYGSSTVYDPNSTSNRGGLSSDGQGHLVNTVISAVDQQVSTETNGWSALLNLAYKLNKNHSISLMFMPNLNGTNNVKYAFDHGDIKTDVLTQSQFYEERKQLIYQFKSEDYIPWHKIKIETTASYTDGKSTAPDFKDVQYWKDPVTGQYQISGSIGNGIHRYYRYLSDNLFDSHLSAELPLANKPGLERKIKFGGAYQRNDRKFDQYDYQIVTGQYNHAVLTDAQDLNQYFNLNSFGIQTYTDNSGQSHSTLDNYYSLNDYPANHTFGRSTIASGFGMLDYAVIPSLRFSGGLRIEQANIYTDVVQFDSLHLAPNDPRRIYNSDLPAINPGKLDAVNYLPSANIIYKLKKDDDAPINLRMNYSQTVARPSIRELSDAAIFDYQYREFVFGNSDLKMTRINNYDLRLESYFKSGGNASVSLFYKDFKNHIELVQSSAITWQNVDKSQVAGIEFEGKKKILKHFELLSNITLVNSETKFVRQVLQVNNGIKTYTPLDTVKRPMFGQAPYVINCIFSYTADSIGLTLALSYNVQGPRLSVASNLKEIPDVYELPRQLFDFKIIKTIGKHFSASITVRNILNSPIRRSYKYAEGWTLDYDKYRYGTEYLFSLLYKL